MLTNTLLSNIPQTTCPTMIKGLSFFAKDKPLIAACAAAKVPMIRLMARIDEKVGYFESIKKLQDLYDGLLPTIEKYGVTMGVQNHFAFLNSSSSHEMINFIESAVGIMQLVGKYDRKHIAAVIDVAHCGLAGEPEAIALDIAKSHLILVNLKNAYWKRATGPEAEDVRWEPYWTNGRQGLASWPTLVQTAKNLGYTGDICLSAEYSAHDDVDRLIAEDVAYARSLL